MPPGLALVAVGAVVAYLVHWAVPALPVLTASVLIGLVLAQIPPLRPTLDGRLRAGVRFASQRLLRVGVVLLGLSVTLSTIGALGWVRIVLVVLLVAAAFAVTYWLGRALQLPGRQPLMLAAGFSICGVSAIGAMSAVTRADDDDTAEPAALVTLFGSLGILVLPLIGPLLGFDAATFGAWVGASLHDVGQVVATAQTAGPAALAAAVAVKLTRVLTLAPMAAITGLVERRRLRRHADSAAMDAVGSPALATRPLKLPPVAPLFVVGFVVAVLIASFVPLPNLVLELASALQTALFALALVALGTSIRIDRLVRRGWRGLVVGAIAWVVISALAYAVVTV